MTPETKEADRPAPQSVEDLVGGEWSLLGAADRDVACSLERLYENTLDWEHLPFLHPETFTSVELVEAGRNWWRARVGRHGRKGKGGPDPVDDVLLIMEPEHRQWAIRTRAERREADHLIHVRVEERSARHVATHVSFHLSTPPRNDAVRAAMFAYYDAQFRRLLAQDGDAIQLRQEALDRLGDRSGPAELYLGTVAEVRARAPFRVVWRGRSFWVVDGPDGPLVHAADCPHMLGPLPPATGGCVVTCPWHGFRFDVSTERSADGRGLRLAPPPTLRLGVDGYTLA